MKNTHGGVLLLVKLQALACNFTKSNTHLWVFFTFFKLYTWYQIAQRTTFIHSFLLLDNKALFLVTTGKDIAAQIYEIGCESFKDKKEWVFNYISILCQQEVDKNLSKS